MKQNSLAPALSSSEHRPHCPECLYEVFLCQLVTAAIGKFPCCLSQSEYQTVLSIIEQNHSEKYFIVSGKKAHRIQRGGIGVQGRNLRHFLGDRQNCDLYLWPSQETKYAHAHLEDPLTYFHNRDVDVWDSIQNKKLASAERTLSVSKLTYSSQYPNINVYVGEDTPTAVSVLPEENYHDRFLLQDENEHSVPVPKHEVSIVPFSSMAPYGTSIRRLVDEIDPALQNTESTEYKYEIKGFKYERILDNDTHIRKRDEMTEIDYMFEKEVLLQAYRVAAAVMRNSLEELSNFCTVPNTGIVESTEDLLHRLLLSPLDISHIPKDLEDCAQARLETYAQTATQNSPSNCLNDESNTEERLLKIEDDTAELYCHPFKKLRPL